MESLITEYCSPALHYTENWKWEREEEEEEEDCAKQTG